MSNTPIAQTQYSYGLGNLQATTVSGSLGGGLYQYPNYTWPPVISEAEKAGKALAIMKELEAEGLIQIDSVKKFCELIDKIASKL